VAFASELTIAGDVHGVDGLLHVVEFRANSKRAVKGNVGQRLFLCNSPTAGDKDAQGDQTYAEYFYQGDVLAKEDHAQ